MENFKLVYKGFADRIIETIDECDDNPPCLEEILSKFKTANVLPRAILYKTLTGNKPRVAALVQRMFSREIAAIMMRYIEQGDKKTDQTEIDAEIEVWHEIWREREKNGLNGCVLLQLGVCVGFDRRLPPAYQN